MKTQTTAATRCLDGLICLLIGSFVVAADWLGTSRFSVDSWSYIELADTLLDGKPYGIHTIRSYWGDPTQSASFPFGFPAGLAIVRAWAPAPMAGVYLNIALATLCGLAMIRLAVLAGTSPSLSRVAALCLLLNPFFIDEILAARSMPLAMACLLWALAWAIRPHEDKPGMFVSGALLGLSCLTRFDFLPLSLGWLILHQVHRPLPQRLLLTGGGLLAGISPWLIYSQTCFGLFWVSDNGWVATAALPSHAMDFPPADRLTVGTAPLAWLHRVGANGVLTWAHLAMAMKDDLPNLLLGLTALVGAVLTADKQVRRLALLLAAWAAATMAPLALTGYHDARYFIPQAALAAWAGTRMAPQAGSLWWRALLTLLMTQATHVHIKYELRRPWKERAAIHQKHEALAQDIVRLSLMQQVHPGMRLVFPPRQHALGAAFGALTKRPAALLPYNMTELKAADLLALQRRLGPVLTVDEQAKVPVPSH